MGILDDERTTLLSKLYQDSGAWGTVLCLFMVLTSFMGFVDAVVNDFLSEKWVIESALKWRHILMMSLAATFAITTFLALQKEALWLIPIHFVNTVVICAAAYFDIRRRLKPK